jgi:hypothetical protein
MSLSAKVRARAGARARKLQGQKTNHPRCGPKRARRRCGGSAETPPSSTPPMVTPLANVRLPACCASPPLPAPPPPPVVWKWGSTERGRQPVIAPQSWLQRPQTLMNNPTHRLLKKKFAQEQRRQQKRTRRGLGRYLRACGLSNRAGCPHRASGWTLAGLLRDAAAGRARGGAGTALRYGSQVRLLGTAPRSIRARNPCTSTPVFSPISAHLPSPHRRHSMLIPTPTHAPSTHILSRTRAICFKHLP